MHKELKNYLKIQIVGSVFKTAVSSQQLCVIKLLSRSVNY